MPLIPTPYDRKIDRLRDRIKRPGKQPRAARKFQNQRAKQYLYQQKNRPETPPAYSSEYESTVGRLGRDLSSTQADLAGRRIATEQQYGFGQDQTNPFSRANMLQRQFQQQAASSRNSYAARGQLYSGALSNQEALDRFGGEQALDVGLREYQGELADLDRQGTSAQSQYDEGVAAAEAQRLESGLQDRPEPGEAPGKPKFVKQFEQRKKRRQRRQRRR